MNSVDPLCCAVYVSNLFKSYDNGGPDALNSFSMTVKKGTIHGLLGSSGCGKTTILFCIVGLQTWDSGNLLVLGQCPGRQLKSKIGYMPQNTSLYEELSVLEVIQFYGRLYKLSESQVRKTWVLLQALLEFPIEQKPIKTLSGGQQRRASLALALVHNPELLVLDEPTVGLDPLLREKIWNYLSAIAKSQNRTIIITSHYMEEARFCDMIGVMRRGQIIAENTPHQILQSYNCDLLDEAVLRLCRENEKYAAEQKRVGTCADKVLSHAKEGSSSNIAITNKKCGTVVTSQSNSSGFHENKSGFTSTTTCFRSRCFDQMHHNFAKIYGFTVVMALTVIRHRVFSVLILAMPAVTCWLAVAPFQDRLRDLHFGVVNQDLVNWKTECGSNKSVNSTSCKFMATCGFINQIQGHNILILDEYESDAVALKHVEMGQSWGYISISANYSTHILVFASQMSLSLNETLEGSRIRLRIDHSHYFAAFFMTKHLYTVYLNYTSQLADLCGMPNKFDLPLKYRPALYGDYGDNYSEFALAGCLLFSIGMLSVCLSALVFASDYQQQTLSRAHLAGLAITDILATHFILQLIITFLQTGVLTGILYITFGYTINGLETQLLYITISLLVGLMAAPMGLLIGILCKHPVTVLVFGVFIVTTFLFNGGIIFPTETTTWFWQQTSYGIPLRVPAAAMRSVLIRGLGITHPMVSSVFLASAVWIFIFVSGIFISFKTLKL